jgi:hypothetical protein
VSASKSSALEPLSKERVQAKLAQAWSRTIASEQFKGNKTAFAAKLGVHPDTVSNALSGQTVPELHTAFNSLLACPNALDELAALFGFQFVPSKAELSPDMQTLHQMCRAMAEFTDALRDGKRTHTETLELAEELRPLIPRLTQIVHEAEGLRSAA